MANLTDFQFMKTNPMLMAGTPWDVGVYIQRGNPMPLDSSSVYETKKAAETYLTTSGAVYPGQVISVVSGDDAGVYVVTIVTPGVYDETKTPWEVKTKPVYGLEKLGSASAMEWEGDMVTTPTPEPTPTPTPTEPEDTDEKETEEEQTPTEP